MKNSHDTRSLLIVSQWFDPEPTFKGLEFAKKLQEEGWTVSVLTGFPNYPGGKIYDGYKIVPFKKESIEGIEVIRIALYPSHDGSSFRRVLNYISFSLMASIAVIFIRKFSVAYLYHPPGSIGLVALTLKLFRGTPYVYDVQDLWPDSLGSTDMVKNRFILDLVSRFMGSVYRAASQVVVLSNGFRKRLLERGVPAEKLTVISNWTYESVPTQAMQVTATSSKLKIIYAGNIGAAQGLDTVLDAALELNNDQVHFEIYGDGIKLREIKELAEKYALENVTFHGRRSTSEIESILKSADLLLVHLVANPLFSVTIPSKTQAYLRSGKPLLMGVDGDAADLVNEAKAGITFQPSSSTDLVRAIREFNQLHPAQRTAMGQSGQRFYEEKLSLSIGSEKFSEILRAASFIRPRTILLKRFLDLFAATILLVVLSIPMAIIALIVRNKLGAPVIYSQLRPGRDGVPFRMYKFRSMTNENIHEEPLLSDAQRLTPFGIKLRASSLDELPELWNVLKGDMSLVGPRPLLLRYSPFFRGEERLRLRVRPGITGWAQIHGRNTVSWDKRLAYDVWYVKNISLKLDLKILMSTFSKVFRSTGVVEIPESIMENLDIERASEKS